jgi:hypothetical protein
MRRLARRRPSAGTIIALVALFFALGGSAYGLVITGRSIKNGTVTGADIRNRSLGSRDVKPDSLGGRAINESKLGAVPSASLAEGSARQAVVTANGVLQRGRGVSSVARAGQGNYQVIFDRDVRNCAYIATLGSPGVEDPTVGQVSVSGLSSNVNGVFVKTTNSSGGELDRAFHLIVSC